MGISAALGSSALLPAGLGFRNVIINGGMDIWQRGTGSISPANGAMTNTDRWVHTGVSTTFTQQTDVPLGFRYSLGVSGSDPSFGQKIEAANAARLAGQTITFSVWAKSISGSTSLFVNFYYPNTTDTFSSLTMISSTTIATSVSSSWTRYTLTTTLPADVSKGLYVLLGRSAGSSNTYYTGIQLEQNFQPTPFEQRPIGVELALCQRYYWRTSSNVGFLTTFSGISYNTNSVDMLLNNPVPMRAAASTYEYSNVGLTDDFSNVTGVTLRSAGSNNNPFICQLVWDKTGGFTTRYLWAAYATTTNSYIGVSAEL